MEASVGHLPAMIVGEAPGKNEDEKGAPFVGSAGRELDKALSAVGFTHGSFVITNLVKCRPPGNRDPEHDEIMACARYLGKELETYMPRYILALGAVATRYFAGSPVSMGSARGRWFQIKHIGSSIATICTWHPAYVMRQQVHSEVWYQFREDVANFGKGVLSGGS
jgi:DNA polymerase